MSADTVTFVSDGLLSKWGFSDGTLLWDVWTAAGGCAVDEQELLVAAVRRFVLPALDQPVEVDEWDTCHNPIRARSVGGVEVRWEILIGREPSPFVITPEKIEVPVTAILKLADELGHAEGTDTGR